MADEGVPSWHDFSVTHRVRPFYGPRVGEALRFAADAFATHERKGTGTPYLAHLLAVAAMVMEHGGDEDQIVAAVLHDYLEDIPNASVEHVEQRFGARVARLVCALSDSVAAAEKPPWAVRKERYLARLRHEPSEVKLISAADKLHNARSIVYDYRAMSDQVFERFTASRDQTLWYYREVVRALAYGFEHPLIERLREAVRELHELARIADVNL